MQRQDKAYVATSKLSITGVPKLGYIYLLEGVHLTLPIEGKNVYILFISNY